MTPDKHLNKLNLCMGNNDIAFLGISEKAFHSANFDPRLSQFSVLNLRNDVGSSIFPVSIGSFSMLIAIRNIESIKKLKIICRDNEGSQVFFTELKIGNEILDQIDSKEDMRAVNTLNPWNLISIPIDKTATIMQPGLYKVFSEQNDSEAEYLGTVQFFFVGTSKLDQEKIAAIKSDPNATKSIKFVLKCNKCGDSLSAIGGLSKEEGDNKEVWYEDLENDFTCNCGSLHINSQYLKLGIPSLIGRPMPINGNVTPIEKLYDESKISTILMAYRNLLKSSPEEATMQEFFQDNYILFHFFSAQRIINKGDIIGKFVTDFVIHAADGTLYLVEIEKPDKPVCKTNGHRHSDFTHACDQVNDWIQEISDHKDAILSKWSIDYKEISRIQGVVIIGRENRDNYDKLRRIKSTNKEILFLTYDDLGNKLESLLASFKEL